jgi:hypothetical protein
MTDQIEVLDGQIDRRPANQMGKWKAFVDNRVVVRKGRFKGMRGV